MTRAGPSFRWKTRNEQYNVGPKGQNKLRVPSSIIMRCGCVFYTEYAPVLFKNMFLLRFTAGRSPGKKRRRAILAAPTKWERRKADSAGARGGGGEQNCGAKKRRRGRRTGKLPAARPGTDRLPTLPGDGLSARRGRSAGMRVCGYAGARTRRCIGERVHGQVGERAGGRAGERGDRRMEKPAYKKGCSKRCSPVFPSLITGLFFP